MSVASKMRGVKNLLTDSNYRFLIASGLGMHNSMSDEEYLSRYYETVFGVKPNLKDPKSFSEKLQWIKLYDRRPEYVMFVDKYMVRKYIIEKIGEQYLIPLLGVWDRAEDIEFDKLPNQFVLKCNHNSGLGMCICKDKTKLDIKKTIKGLKKGLSENYFFTAREWPYKDVTRRIICEKYMVDQSDGASNNQQNGLNDYKIFCFNGKAKFFKVDYDRFTDHHANYYDLNGKLLPFGEAAYPPNPNKNIYIPKNIDKMIQIAEKLSNGYPFIRVDLYNISGKIYFGELTLFPISGLGQYTPNSWDLTLGDMLQLPHKEEIDI